MSSDRDTTRIVRSWLEDGATALPDRVLDRVLDQLPATPQRRATWWPARRFADMNTFAKIAIAAAAVLIVAVVGINLLPTSGVGLGNPPDSASPSPSPSPTASPSPSPTPVAEFPPAGELAIGRHSMTLSGVPFTFELSTAGWLSNGSFAIDKGSYVEGANPEDPDSAGFIFWGQSAPDNVFADPCAGTPLAPPPDATSAALAEAVASIPGTEVASGPTEVTVGGHPAQHVAITVPDDIACAANDFYLWEDSDFGPGNSRYATEVGSTIHTWIIEVDGTFGWIDAETYAFSGPEAEEEILQIIDSIEFE